jgi:hypothetical protein
MFVLPRKPIKNEGCEKEGHSIERRDEEERNKRNNKDESSNKQFA